MDGFSFSLILSALAAVALLLTTLASILGVRFEYRNQESGKLTPAGRRVIALTVLIALIGMASIWGEFLHRQAESKRSASEVADLRLRLDRAILPIASLRVLYLIDSTQSPIAFAGKGCNETPIPIPLSSIPGTWNKKWVEESGIKDALQAPDVSVYAFKIPVDPQTFRGYSSADHHLFEREPDLQLRSEQTKDFPGIWTSDCGRKVGFYGRASRPEWGTGEILSTADLDGVQLVVVVEAVNRFSVLPNIVDVTLDVSGRQQATIRGWKSYQVRYEDIVSDNNILTARIFAHTLSSSELKYCCLGAPPVSKALR